MEQLSFCPIVFLSKYSSEETFSGQTSSGQTSSGQMSSGQMSLWTNVFMGKRRLGKCHLWQMLYGQMSPGKCFWANVSSETPYGQMSEPNKKYSRNQRKYEMRRIAPNFVPIQICSGGKTNCRQTNKLTYNFFSNLLP
jgi:hypothetical protein